VRFEERVPSLRRCRHPFTPPPPSLLSSLDAYPPSTILSFPLHFKVCPSRVLTDALAGGLFLVSAVIRAAATSAGVADVEKVMSLVDDGKNLGTALPRLLD
jgi:hypothetical protein